MNNTAQRRFETAHSLARRVVAVALLTSLAPAQAPTWADIDTLAVAALDAKDPTTRGEAALWLASSQQAQHYRAILSIARDPEPEARHRAIAALGRLAAPGADSFLAKLALGGTDPEDALLATFALGQLDHVSPAPAIDTLLRRTQGASVRRNADLLAALLGGLCAGGAHGRATMLIGLRDSESTRITAIRELAHAALASAERAEVSRDLASAWLHRPDPTFRRLALQHWSGQWPIAASERDQLRRVARSDAAADVRAAGIDLLARQLDPFAIDLAGRALASPHAGEAAAGARALLRLSGVARLPAIEERATNERTSTQVRLGLLATLAGPLQPKTIMALRDLAYRDDAPGGLRVAAALALARTDSSLTEQTLKTVFRGPIEGGDLSEVARTLQARQLLDAEVERLATDHEAGSSPHFAAQLRAIATADATAACSLTLRLHANGHLHEPHLGAALAGLRRARNTTTTPIRAWLPPVIVALDL